MKVLIRGHETCGVIADLAGEFRRRGDDVITVAHAHQLFARDYDYDLYRLWPSFKGEGLRRSRPVHWLRRGTQRIAPERYEQTQLRLEKELLAGIHLYVQVWAGLPRDEHLLPYLKAQGTHVATLCMGSDVRDYGVFQQQYDVSCWTFPPECYQPPLPSKLRALRLHERYADALFSVPDQMGLALRPYHHLQVPVDLKRMQFRIPGRAVPLVVHAPSKPSIKGSDVIEAALQSLRDEGVRFDLISVRGMPHQKVLSLLSEADVLVDELVFHGPGWLGFEAMASGCAVATRYLEDSPPCFRPPIIPITQHTIRSKLKELLTSRELRLKRAEQGRRYVEAHNTVERVVDSIVRKTIAGGHGRCDYLPRFCREGYRARDANERHIVADADSDVSKEEWFYRRFPQYTSP